MLDGQVINVTYTDSLGVVHTVQYEEGYIESEAIPDGKPNIRDTDSDNDGLSDFVEGYWNSLRSPVNAGWNPGDYDTDDDGVADFTDVGVGGDPGDGRSRASGSPPDVDGDGLLDVFEQGGAWQTYATTLGDKDSDDDGISDGTEDKGGTFLITTRPDNSDTDGDGIQDGTELGVTSGIPGGAGVGTDPAVFVPDADNTTKTDPTLVDSDSDGLSDGAEDVNNNGAVDPGESDPNDPDTDNDFVVDGSDTDPLVAEDTDNDGLRNWMEKYFTSTDPNNSDTDGDGLADGYVDADVSGTFSAGDTPGELGSGTLTFNNVTRTWEWTNPSDGSSEALVNRSGGGQHPAYTSVTEPLMYSTDFDGISDGVELDVAGIDADPATYTNPFNANSDSDLLYDGYGEDQDLNGKVDVGETDPNNRDSDGDNVNDGYDGWETAAVLFGGGAAALSTDADGDGWNDGDEIANGTLPVYTYSGGSDTDLDGRNDNVGNENSYAAAKDNDQDDDYLFDGVGEDVNLNGVVDAGETDPVSNDTDGDGVVDGYDGWETATLDQPDGDATVNALDTNSDGDGWVDGDEINTYHTSAILVDTDGDGRNEGVGNEDNNDPDNDGIISALDVDSDSDWYLDGSGNLFGNSYPAHMGDGEDSNNNGTVDAGETSPIQVTDQDGDNLPDWVEYSFGTGINNTNSDGDGFNETPHNSITYTSADRQFYPDINGDFRLIGETDGVNYYTTDPRNPDTDNDGLNDDIDVAVNGNPLDNDTDNDGLVDGVEDANANGAHDVGETYVDNVDSDSDGLIDGWEVNADVLNNGGNDEALNNDVDGDNIPDGVEWGVPGQDADVSTYTDMASSDTDGDLVDDGLEDQNHNGRWDVSPNFHYIFSAAAYRSGEDNGAAPGDEMNPLDVDTDHGGAPDGTEDANLNGIHDPGETWALDATDGDRLFHIEDENGNLVANDTLTIDPLPGDTGYVLFRIVNTYGVNINKLNVTWTAVEWTDTLYYYPDTFPGMLIPSDSIYAVGIDEGNVINSNPYLDNTIGNGLPTTDVDTLILVAKIPWGTPPGKYDGRVVLWYGLNPIDTLVLRVIVEGTTDLDVANWDSLPNGVGASDQDSTGAIDNVMNLIFNTGLADTGIFFVSNPNLYPDNNNDGANDVNGGPAVPQPNATHFQFTPANAADSIGGWDPDSQGNMAAYYVRYRYYAYNVPAGIDTAAVRQNVVLPGLDTLLLGSLDSN
ncbi:MAG: hypothetical protein QI197_07885, partial [Candidatus Korarchaeota archaeon]|nr:hypothetical protein [Candidatus Korarchaeota archaeon]